jgi:hypothetical protein
VREASKLSGDSLDALSSLTELLSVFGGEQRAQFEIGIAPEQLDEGR